MLAAAKGKVATPHAHPRAVPTADPIVAWSLLAPRPFPAIANKAAQRGSNGSWRPRYLERRGRIPLMRAEDVRRFSAGNGTSRRESMISKITLALALAITALANIP